ncbi:MAG: hypothetical protein ACM34K_11730 [Bacillota bacterium]
MFQNLNMNSLLHFAGLKPGSLQRWFVPFFCIFFLSGFLWPDNLPPDDKVYHLTLSQIKSDSLNGSTKGTFDFWITDSKVKVKTSYRWGILRFDLNKEWRIPLKGNHYFETPIIPAADAQKQINIHSSGFRYEPVYTWIITGTEEEKKIGSYNCRHFIAHGDAECSERIIDLWLTTDLPDVFSILNNTKLKEIVFGDSYWGGLFDSFAALKNSTIVYSREFFSNYYGPDTIIELYLLNSEAAKPEDASFDPPKDKLKIE